MSSVLISDFAEPFLDATIQFELHFEPLYFGFTVLLAFLLVLLFFWLLVGILIGTCRGFKLEVFEHLDLSCEDYALGITPDPRGLGSVFNVLQRKILQQLHIERTRH